MSRAPTPSSRRLDRRPTLQADVLATLALAAFSTAVAAGFARVFTGWGFFDNLLALIVVGHGTSLALRRARVSGWVAVPVVAVLLGWTIGALHYRFTYSYLVPTGDTIDLFWSEIELVRDQFRTAVAPVLYGAGWDVLASIGLGLAVLLGDTFAFRAGARAEALVPGGVLFVFVAALGEDRDRLGLSIAVVAAGVLATVVLRSYHAPTRAVTVGRRRSRVALAIPAGVVTAAAVALVAGAVGPRLPGAGAEPLYDTPGGGDGSLTTVVNPLVDIRSRLTNRTDVELFRVRSSLPSYWRSSSLPAFDGTTWSLPERSIETADGTAGGARPGTVEIAQEVQIVNLRGNLVPAAPDPIALSGPVSATDDRSTLVKTDGDLVAGELFEIVSASPRFTADELRGATTDEPPDPIYLELPDDFSDEVRAVAEQLTADAATPYDAAIQLQQWFTTEFEYSLEVQSGHGNNAMEAFLRERVGYCEQFAGTYAAMLRSQGIPARVNVGFTWGNQEPDGTFSVLGKNAHAWPEVWFDGFGWVLFEPTPGRGAPGAETHTGQSATQDDSGVDPNAAPTEQPPPPPSTVPEPVDDQFVDPAPVPEDPGTDFEVELGALQDDGGGDGPSALLIGLVIAVVALLAPAVVRRIRRRSHLSPERELGRLWRRSLDAARDVGVDPPPSATPLEAAALTHDRFPIAARPFRSLAEAVTEVTYRRGASDQLDTVRSYGSSTIRDCANWTRQIERATNDSLGLPMRIRRYFTRWS